MNKVRQIHGVREESSTGFVDDMDELRRELDENEPLPAADHAMGQQYDSEDGEDQEQYLTLGDGTVGQVNGQQDS